MARQVLADDLGLLADLDAQIAAAEAKMAELLPDTPFAPLTHRARLGQWSGPATTAPRSATRTGGRAARAALPRLRSVPGAVRVGREAS